MAKLTASDLIRMAAAQGIHLTEAGTPASADLNTIRAQDTALAEARADASKWRQAYEGMRMQRQEPANLAELQDCKDALAKAIRERDDARSRLASMPAVPVEGATVAKLQGELFEARAEVASLQRTVAKLRPLAQRGDSIPEATPGTIRVTFNGFPGWAIVERLRAFGTWDKRDKAWHLTDSDEARNYLVELRNLGVPLIVA